MNLSLSDYLLVCLSQATNLNIEKLQGVKVIKRNLYEDYNSLLKSNTHVILLISVTKLNPLIENIILSVKLRFNHVPILVHLKEFGLETVRKCGELGVEKVIDTIDEELPEILNSIIQNQVTVRMIDFNINLNKHSLIVQNALKIIENNYIKLAGTGEIAEIMDLSDCTIIREFKKNKILSPKKLLLLFNTDYH